MDSLSIGRRTNIHVKLRHWPAPRASMRLQLRDPSTLTVPEYSTSRLTKRLRLNNQKRMWKRMNWALFLMYERDAWSNLQK